MKRKAGSGKRKAGSREQEAESQKQIARITHHVLRFTSDVSHSRGFTLTELLVTLAILSLVTGLLTLIVYQLLTIPRWGNDQLAVDGDLRNAGLWLVRDGNESEAFTGTAGTCTPFTFDTGAERGIVYTYTLGAGTLNREASDSGRTIGVARHADGVQCPSGTTTGTVAITLSSASGDVSASQTYTVTLRVR